jgi:ABC-2 type transport system permease protein
MNPTSKSVTSEVRSPLSDVNKASFDIGQRMPDFGLLPLGALFVLTLRQHLRGRRLLVLSLLFLLPSVLAAIASLTPHSPPPEHLEFAFVFNLIPLALATLTALLYAAGIIQDEVEEQTLTYLLMRPLPRWALYLTKLVVTMLVTMVLTGVFTTLTLVVIYWNTDQLLGEVLPWRALKIASLLALALAAYCSLFGAIGLLLRRSMIVGLAYIIVFEGLLSGFVAVARQLTVMYYFRLLVLYWLDPPDGAIWKLDLDNSPSATRCVNTLLAATAVFALVSAAVMMRREFRMKTPDGS